MYVDMLTMFLPVFIGGLELTPPEVIKWEKARNESLGDDGRPLTLTPLEFDFTRDDRFPIEHELVPRLKVR